MEAGPGDNCIKDNVQEYYGKTIKKTEDFVCKLRQKPRPAYVKDILSKIHQEIAKKYFGCGMIIPESLEGMSVLDLGSGAGQDCFVLSKLVGESGSVTGVDMTDEQLAIANQYIDYHTKQFGFTKPNVKFVKGDIEQLDKAGLQDNSFDIVVSNCVLCLLPDKKPALREAFRVLKNGGELYFSDICVDRTIPPELKNDKVMWGEGLTGAWRWEELCDICEEMGFSKPRVVSVQQYDITKFKDILGDAKYIAANIRLFKISQQENSKASNATYKGGILGSEESFDLDRNLTFKVGHPVPVSREVVNILKQSRFEKYFDIENLQENTNLPKEDVATMNPFNG